MAPVRNWPEWVKLAIAIGTLLVSGVYAWADAKADLRVEISERKLNDSHIEQSVDEIKTMLREELNRHHPRQ